MNTKFKVKLMAFLLASTMILTMTACSKGEGNEKETEVSQNDSNSEVTESTVSDPMEKYQEPVTITTVISLDDTMQAMLGVNSDIGTNNNWYKGLKEDLGIQVENIWSVPASQYQDKLNAQISADDLPDLFLVTPDQLKGLVDNGMVMDLTTVFQKYTTDFTKRMMDEDNKVALSQGTYNGKLMALPNVSGNHDAVPIMWIRRDWLEKVGKDIPTTIDELEEVALAFVNEDPDGNGVKDTYGIALSNDLYSNGLSDMTGILEGFGAHNGWVDVDGKAAYGLIQPEVKTTLEKMASWYQKGIIDKEFVAKNSGKVAEDIIAGKVGITFGQHWNAFWPFQDAKNLNMDADWLPCPIPSATGQKAQVMVGNSAAQFFAVNVNCKNPEAIIKMYNYFYQKDCALSEDYDPTFHISSSLQMEHPEQSFVWAPMKTFYAQQNLYIYRGIKAYLDGDKTQLDNAWVSDNVGMIESYLDDSVTNVSAYSSYIWSGPEGAFSVVDTYEQNDQRLQNMYILGNTDGMLMYNVSLSQLILENFTRIIYGESDISSFDDTVSDWKMLGGDQITQEVNDVLGK